MLIIGDNVEADDDSLEGKIDGIDGLDKKNMPSHEIRVMTKGKRIENRFIIKNSQGDLK
jgi:hypothetical protein